MSAGAIAIAVLVLLLLGVPVTFAILRDEQRKRREWRPEGYRRGPEDSRAVVHDWWRRPLPLIGLRQSLTLAGEASPSEVVEIRDPRLVGASRQRKAVSAHG